MYHYHISWLETAIREFKKRKEFNTVDGSMTISEFIEYHNVDKDKEIIVED